MVGGQAATVEQAVQFGDVVVIAVPLTAIYRLSAALLARDNAQSKQMAREGCEAFGFDALDVGALAEGWRFERGTPSYCVRMTKEALLAALAKTPAR